MATLPSHFYQDPAKVIEIEESKTCKGCLHKLTLWGLEYCAKEQTKPGMKNMRRCSLYKDRA
ncbi:hypothetical protein AB870_02725 [Pandoraea faecigallinarum]|uniref:Uncharacterized protein n=1 Tax=Pandoraea faecigallinarum TaxID=656179 RepID=A0A0H3WP84_9BURK|nr:hypothetical protein AB870_02725 [Pandoraea faecigallinarum]